MRVLIVTTLFPTQDRPGHGSFVADQVRALSRLPDLEIEVFRFSSAGSSSYAAAARDLRRRYGGSAFDVVHAHFGLTAWPALALRGARHGVTLHGTDLAHPRSRAITLAAVPFLDLVAPVSESLAKRVPRALVRGRLEILPAGVDTERFHPIARDQARRELGLDEGQRYVLFPSDPARPEKRFDRAQAVAGELPILTLRDIDPQQVPLWVNAADAVLVPSDREGFGLAVLEALACRVPVLATPVGVAPAVLAGVEGSWCARFDAGEWRSKLDEILTSPDPRIPGNEAAEAALEPFSAQRTAERLASVWRSLG
jgi:glycosyltransferase involved in cell wall biosynthesis